MNKMYRVFILFFSALYVFSSCNIESVTTINADGSGYSENIIILDDQLKAMIEMMGALEEGENPLIDDSNESSSADAFNADAIFAELFEGDTTMTFAELALQDSVEISQTNLDLLSKMKLGLKDGQWYAITSELAEEAVAQLLLDKESTFSSGAISTTTAIIPNDYELFTVGTNTAIQEEIAIVKVFPNPTVKDLYVDIKKAGIQKGSILIYDGNGRQMIERKFDDSSKTTQRFDVSNYSDGLFKVQVKSTDIQITEPFIISNH